jgi:uncharacterized protein (TIGR02118 family)
MRHHFPLAALLTTILLAPSPRLHAQHEQHAASLPAAARSMQSALPASVDRDIARLRAATSSFRSLDDAVAAGYERDGGRCIGHPQLGAMGYHHQKASLVDGKLEVERPEVLVYRKGPGGGYELTGVEYQVPYSIAPRDSAPPTIMGQPLKRFDAIKMWYLHAWPWLDNPSGMFADWNPKVSCTAVEPTVSLNVIYPRQDGARFDMSYYRSTHIPLVTKVMAATSVTLIEGMPMSGSAAPYVMIAHFEFPSAAALTAALANPAMADVRADVARFTDIKPTLMMGKP